MTLSNGSLATRSDSVSSPLSLDRLPSELTAGARFVLWRFEARGGKRTKVPYQPLRPDVRASVTAPETWGTYPDTIRAMSSVKADGMGRVLGDGLFVIDLDGSPRPEERDYIAQRAMGGQASRIRNRISPSGTGLHVWCRGGLPAGRRRNGWIEVYEQGRYMSLTGWHFAGSRESLEERTQQVASLYQDIFDATGTTEGNLCDSEVLTRAAEATNGGKFGRLFEGDLSSYGDDDSAADLALCSLLAFWTRKNSAQMDRLFRVSNLMRAKWDQPRGARTYGEIDDLTGD